MMFICRAAATVLLLCRAPPSRRSSAALPEDGGEGTTDSQGCHGSKVVGQQQINGLPARVSVRENEAKQSR
jgi:hypothetical protein